MRTFLSRLGKVQQHWRNTIVRWLWEWTNWLLLGEYATFQQSTNVIGRIWFLFFPGRFWWPTHVQGTPSDGSCINGNWLCPSWTAGHLHARQQIRFVDAECAKQQAMKYCLNWLAECDSIVILNVISQLNAKNKKPIFLLSEKKLKMRAHIKDLKWYGITDLVDMPTYTSIATTPKQLIWQRQSNSWT